MTAAPAISPAERRVARASADQERLEAAGRELGRAAGPLPPDIAARVAAVLTKPADRSTA